MSSEKSSLAASSRPPRPSPIPAHRSTRCAQAAIDDAPSVHRGSRQARRADPRPAGGLQRTVLLPVAGRALVRHRRAGARSDDRAAWRSYAKKYRMAMVVPVYEREQAGVYYNTAAVYDDDGTYLGKYRKNHIPHTSRVLGEVLLQARQPRLPGVQDALRDGRRLHLLRPPLPGRRAAARPERRGDRLQPVSDGRRALAVPVEARAAGARRRQRLLHGLQQPRRHRGALEHRPLLRVRPTSSIRAATSWRRGPRTRTSS